MLTTILGDIVGSRYEFFITQETDVIFFHGACSWTDDTICTYATSLVCEKIKKDPNLSDDEIEVLFFEEFKRVTRLYPMAGYGYKFLKWTQLREYRSSDSYGNGCLMRISPIILHFDDLDLIQRIGRICTQTSHNHPDSLKAVQAYLEILYFLKKKPEVPKKIVREIMEKYHYTILSVEEYCQIGGYYGLAKDTLPRAVSSYLEADSFEQMCKNVLYIGADTDTNAAIAGALVELTYGINNNNLKKVYRYFDHKNFDIVKGLCNVYLENKSVLEGLYTSENFGLIKEIYEHQPVDQTAAFDPLMMPSDEDYYKNAPEKIQNKNLFKWLGEIFTKKHKDL